jgi:hypothetical protein
VKTFASSASLAWSLAMGLVSVVAAADTPAVARTGTIGPTRGAATGPAAPTGAVMAGLAPTGATPSFQSLPEGHVASMPSSHAPATVAAGAKVAGFVVVGPPPEQSKALRGSETGVTYVFSTAARARAMFAGNGQLDDRGPQTCFVDGESASEEEGGSRGATTPTPPHPWPSQAASMEAMSFQLSGAGAVHPMHAERLSVDGRGNAALATTDVWLDARTRGAKLIGHGSLSLRRVFIGPNGLEVYAARDGAGLQIVVRAASSPIEGASAAARVASELGTLTVVLPGGTNGGGDCGHARFELRPKPGEGQMATLQSVALLPPLAGDEAVTPAGDEAPSPDAIAAVRLQAMRRRPFQLSVSATESSSDDSPVLSVAVGWLGRERRNGS